MKYPLNLLQYYVDFCKFLSITWKDVLWNKNYFKQYSRSSTIASFGQWTLADDFQDSQKHWG